MPDNTKTPGQPNQTQPNWKDGQQNPQPGQDQKGQQPGKDQKGQSNPTPTTPNQPEPRGGQPAKPAPKQP